MLQDLAFVPLQVFIVTLVLERILSAREKREILRKTSVVISAFYSEVGTEAISTLSSYIKNIQSLRGVLNINAHWTENGFKAAVKSLSSFEYQISSENGDLRLLKEFLAEKKSFMLSLFENTNLLEHDT
ncbi:MAG: hypothetical protein N2484_02865, partial [Clostridia bacterium]|nr:hypothetical protein [Clostridia bacterium]